MILWLGSVIGLLIGVIFGWAICRAQFKKKSAGTLRVDSSDPSEAPYLFLELKNEGMNMIRNGRIVIFTVNLDGYMPRK